MYKITSEIYRQKIISQRSLLILFIILIVLNLLHIAYGPGRKASDPYYSGWTFLWLLLGMRSYYKIKILKLELKLLTSRPINGEVENIVDEKIPQDIKSEYKLV